MNVFGLFEVSEWLVAVLLILLATYWYFHTKRYTFEKAGIPGPRPLPLFGNLLMFTKRGFEGFDLDIVKKYGPIIGTYTGSQPVLVVADPDLLKQIFIKDVHVFTNRLAFNTGEELFSKMVSVLKGEQWKMTRSILTPTFSASKMKNMMPLISSSTEGLIKNILFEAKNGTKFETKSVFGKFTMDVIAKTMFGLDINCQTEEENDFVKYAKKAFNFNLRNPAFLLFISFPKFIPFFKALGIKIFDPKVTKFFVDVSKEVIEIRRKGDAKYNDFIQLMLNSHLDEEFVKQVEQEGGGEARDKLQKGLTDMEILAQALIFFLAGYETTASLLAWTSYCLAVNQDVQETLREEIKSKLGDKEDITYDDVHEFPYLDNVINETLRMHPPALRFDRILSEDYELAGYNIPAGVDVQAPVYYLHHNEEWWDEPFKFKPERFNPENKANRNPYVFVPFGLGPRNCIGMRFALIEAKVALCAVLRKSSLELAPGMMSDMSPLNKDCNMKKGGFHYPEDGIWLKATAL